MTPNTVKRAHNAFNQGDYQAAKTLYQQAAVKYGQNLFDVNIYLCQQKQRLQRQPSEDMPNIPTTISASQQLEETQSLLEHYYRRCQELEYRLQDAG